MSDVIRLMLLSGFEILGIGYSCTEEEPYIDLARGKDWIEVYNHAISASFHDGQLLYHVVDDWKEEVEFWKTVREEYQTQWEAS